MHKDTKDMAGEKGFEVHQCEGVRGCVEDLPQSLLSCRVLLMVPVLPGQETGSREPVDDGMAYL